MPLGIVIVVAPIPQMATFWPSLLTSSALIGNGPSSRHDAASVFVTRCVLPVRSGALMFGRRERLIVGVSAWAEPAALKVPYAAGQRLARPPRRANSAGATRSTVAGRPVFVRTVCDAAKRNARTWSAVEVAVRTAE